MAPATAVSAATRTGSDTGRAAHAGVSTLSRAYSFFFPFAVALLGLSLILVTVLAQRWLSGRSD